MNIYIEEYGCTANKSDACIIKGLILENGNKIVEQIKDAEVIIILTCIVIDTTEQRMISRLKSFKKFDKKIVVSGCMASILKDKIKTISPTALVLPPQYVYYINDILEKHNIKFETKNKTIFPKYYESVIAPIGIAEGCKFSCSYCITCRARGKLKSYPVNEIKTQISNAVKNGCKEIQLTAQDTSSYGYDLNENLGSLLRCIRKIKGRYKIRVGMMNPYTLIKNLDSIIDGFNFSKIYKFIHIPVQSGNNQILNKMKRKYKVEEFESVIKKFKQLYPEMSISTDIIVGFPGETDEQFEDSVNLTKIVRPDITNITRFSSRPGTVAKKLKNRVKTDIVKERSRILSKLCQKISYENNKKCIGKDFKLLIVEKGKFDTWIGRNDNYKPVVINESVKIGDIVQARISNAEITYLVGRLI